ncbi:MAG: prepilin peptidase [Muribaculaceae bacterium]|nr:prepilin peptidase [Muribaculaceae bacterium]
MQIINQITEIVAFVFMGICAFFDIKKKEIPVYLAAAGIIAALGVNLFLLYRGDLSAAETAGSLLPGGFFLIVSFLTKEKVGYGDGLLLLTAGLFLGFYRCCFCLCISLLGSSVFAILLLGLGKAGKNSKIPFAPFLAIGLGVGIFV